MNDLNLIYEAYKNVNEAQFSYAGNYSDSSEQPKKQLAKFRRPKPDFKNSSGLTTASLPGGTRSVNIAAMGSGGGLSENEETTFKGGGNVPNKDVHSMYNKVMKEVHELYNQKKFKQLESKLELLAMLSRNL